MHLAASDFRTCLTCCSRPPTKKKNIRISLLPCSRRSWADSTSRGFTLFFFFLPRFWSQVFRLYLLYVQRGKEGSRFLGNSLFTFLEFRLENKENAENTSYSVGLCFNLCGLDPSILSLRASEHVCSVPCSLPTTDRSIWASNEERKKEYDNKGSWSTCSHPNVRVPLSFFLANGYEGHGKRFQCEDSFVPRCKEDSSFVYGIIGSPTNWDRTPLLADLSSENLGGISFSWGRWSNE